MFGLDLENLQVYHVLAWSAGGLIVLALVVSLVAPKGFKVPAAVLGTIGGLVAGLALGVIGMASFGYKMSNYDGPELPAGPPVALTKGGGMMGGGMPGGGMPGGGGKGKNKGFPGPSPQVQLTTLVIKIHQLTDKPLSLSLSDDQRSVLREQLHELADKEELTEADAKDRFDKILEAIKADRTTLEAAGFRWPAQGGGMPAPPPMILNPFKTPENRERLASLQQRLAGK